MEAALKQQEIIEDDRFWRIHDMAQGMRVEHDRLAQLGWVYDGFGGYRKKAAQIRASVRHEIKRNEPHGAFI
jgi:hypothetical protein